MNNVTLIGRLTRDPEVRHTNTGLVVARFSLAVDKNLSREKRAEMQERNEPTADFINIVAWGKLAENVERFTGKGNRVAVQGRIQTGSYEGRDGNRVYTTDIVAGNIEFIDWKDSNRSSGSSYNSSNEGNSSNDFFGNDFNPLDDFDSIGGMDDNGRVPF